MKDVSKWKELFANVEDGGYIDERIETGLLVDIQNRILFATRYMEEYCETLGDIVKLLDAEWNQDKLLSPEILIMIMNDIGVRLEPNFLGVWVYNNDGPYAGYPIIYYETETDIISDPDIRLVFSSPVFSLHPDEYEEEE